MKLATICRFSEFSAFASCAGAGSRQITGGTQLARCLLDAAVEMVAEPPVKSLFVTVVAARRETIEALHTYLQGAGVASHATQALTDPALLSPGTTAVVLFPDEFDRAEVVHRVLSLRTARAPLLLVVVTGTPQRFRPALDPDAHGLLPIVLPKPAFGWSILDALRGQDRAESPNGADA